MDEDIRAQLINEIVSTDYCIERSETGSLSLAEWRGYKRALQWVLYLIDYDATAEDPVLTEEEQPGYEFPPYEEVR